MRTRRPGSTPVRDDRSARRARRDRLRQPGARARRRRREPRSPRSSPPGSPSTGLEVTVDEPLAGRPSVVGVARGTGGGASLMLNAHLDTVNVDGMERPHDPVVRDGRLYGRGAYDMKGGLAAIMVAGRRGRPRRAERRRHRQRGGRRGARQRGRPVGPAPLARRRLHRHRADAPARVRRAQGLRVGAARDPGPRGARLAPRPRRRRDRRHGARARRHPGAAAPPRGAAAPAARRGEPARLADRRRPGAVELSRALRARRRAADRCRASPRRTSSASCRSCSRSRATPIRGSRPQLRMGLVREPFEVDPSAAIVDAVRAAAARTLGAEPELVGHPAWMDAAFLSAAGIPTVVFGPSGEGAHAVAGARRARERRAGGRDRARDRAALLRMSDRDATVDVAWNPARDPAWTPRPGLEDQARALHHALEGYAPTPLHGAPSLAARARARAPSCSRTRARASACPRSRRSARGGRRPGPWPTAWARRPSPPDPTALRDRAARRAADARVRHRGQPRPCRGASRALARARGAGRGAGRHHAGARAGDRGRGRASRARRRRLRRRGRGAAASLADDRHLVIADTSWPGYEEVPRRVVEGYATIFAELDAQLDGRTVDLVVVPIGVGSLAAAAARHFRATPGERPRLVGLEPIDAACALASARAGHAGHDRRGPELGHGRPELPDAVDGRVAAGRRRLRRVLRRRRRARAARGCGGWRPRASTAAACAGGVVGGLTALLGDPAHREALALPEHATALLVLTEGVTDARAVRRGRRARAGAALTTLTWGDRSSRPGRT